MNTDATIDPAVEIAAPARPKCGTANQHAIALIAVGIVWLALAE